MTAQKSTPKRAAWGPRKECTVKQKNPPSQVQKNARRIMTKFHRRMSVEKGSEKVRETGEKKRALV